MASKVKISYAGCGKTSTCKKCKAEYQAARYQQNKEKIKAQVMEYREANKDKYKAYQRRWKKSCPWRWAERERAKRARCRIPLSITYKKEMQEIYKNRPEGHEVDHIVPLNGENVSGLHVPWNLQYLTKEENRLKGNKHGE